MDVVWFVVLSALIFAIGAAGVMTRRSPLVILLCTELMTRATWRCSRSRACTATATARSSR
jgi:NADH:ubiquinone oxidoreductase subunit K